MGGILGFMYAWVNWGRLLFGWRVNLKCNKLGVVDRVVLVDLGGFRVTGFY